MGRVFSVDFEDPNYYMCKNCRTHIAAPVDPGSMSMTEQSVGHFITVINVEAVNERRQLCYWIPEPHTVSDVYCIKCGEKLGLKVVWIYSDERVVRNDPVYALGMDKLFWRKGDEIRDGQTLIPAGFASNGFIHIL